jgi:hypothetical protein
MSQLRLVIRDAQRDISGDEHGSVAQAVVAALSAEPETIEELGLAMERFDAPPESGRFAHFRDDVDDRPYDAGVMVVDLAARLVACASTYCDPGPHGYVTYHDGHSATDMHFHYNLSEDWEFTNDMDSWRGLADERRRARRANPPLDARAVLYGQPLLEFVARECLAVAGTPRPIDGATDAEYDKEYALSRAIHVKWMMTAREDLRGATPRDILLARRQYIDRDLQDRANQWSQSLRPPRPLDAASAAYRLGGMGTHEIVTYYDLIREMIWSARKLVGQMPAAGSVLTEPPANALMVELAKLREEWFDRPDPDFGNRTPRGLIENERRRLPEAGAADDAVIDDDCPLCQMQADMPGPGFWHLDGCEMDDDFAFSFHRTREEFEAEQREHEESYRRWAAEDAERDRLGVTYPGGDGMGSDGGSESLALDRPPGGHAPFMRLFTIGSRLCGITVALKHPTENRPLIDRLSRDYGNLREVAQGNDGPPAEALIGPVLDRFGESLDAVAAARPDLEAKCADLREQLARFTTPADQTDAAPPMDGDGEWPF